MSVNNIMVFTKGLFRMKDVLCIFILHEYVSCPNSLSGKFWMSCNIGPVLFWSW